MRAAQQKNELQLQQTERILYLSFHHPLKAHVGKHLIEFKILPEHTGAGVCVIGKMVDLISGNVTVINFL